MELIALILHAFSDALSPQKKSTTSFKNSISSIKSAYVVMHHGFVFHSRLLSFKMSVLLKIADLS
jgi:hypothetical protein